MTQEIVRTEDVIECLDDRIHASSDHTNLGVTAGEIYPSVLDKIELQMCSPAQKAALSRTLTDPSDLNPVVLKDDIVTYYPSDDLGEFRDAVDTVLDLPLTGNNLGDLRPVLSISAIYRWDGAAWTPFIKTGTIDHTQLIDQNADSNYLHVTLSELSSLINQSHDHINKTILDAILSIGSGIIIADSERIRIPTSDEKDALVGSVYVPPVLPSSTNKYVTNVDPRLNTIKNPYITFGPAGSGATFEGSDITDIETAFAAVSTGGSIDFINAIEFLPGTYPLNTINYQGMVWNDPKPILIEALASRQTVLQLATQPLGSTAFWIASGDGQVTVRGVTFELGTDDILGCLIERDNTVFEDCTFTTSSLFPIPTGTKGIQIDANGVNLRRCVFKGNIAQAIIINGDYCLVENCRFILSSSFYSAIDITGNYNQITASEISQGSVLCSVSSQDTIFDKVRLTNTSFIDAGTNTRWLGSISQDYQQAYIGRTRTVGPINSHADFRGTSETPFLAAMANSDSSEVEVLDGTYNFTSPVTVPAGKSFKSVRKNAVFINGANCFILNDSTKLYGFNISITGMSGISLFSISDVEIKNCIITMNGPDVPTNYSIEASSVTDFRITHCQFNGTRAVKLTGDVRTKIVHNMFSNSVYSVVSDITSSDLYYGDNTEEGSVCSLAGSRLIVRGNHFLGSIPMKLGTLDSLWIGNYPSEANNTNGIDDISISMASFMKPLTSTGASRSSFLGTASIAFTETGTPTIATSPIKIDAKIDRTQGYSVTLQWTASVFSGDVLWEVTTVFRDRSDFVSDLGTPTVKTAISSRTYLTVRQEQSVTIPFTSSDYGYILGVDPSHVSLMIRRLGDDPLDTLPGIAYLTEAIITLPRD